jgi:hypothetical protein
MNISGEISTNILATGTEKKWELVEIEKKQLMMTMKDKSVEHNFPYSFSS